jgi:CelD/BcsL family acetyltransferase involved in cellulose biosynthesis
MAVRKGAYTAMPAGAPMADYQGLVADPAIAVEPERLVRALKVQRLDFTRLAASEAFAPFGRAKSRSQVIEAPKGYRAYAAAQRKAGVKTIGELDELRAAADAAVGPLRFTPRSTSKGDLEQLIELARGEARAAGEADVFAAEWPLRLVRDLLAETRPGFGAKLFTLHLGDHLAAIQLCLAGEATLHAWIGAEIEALAPYQPGDLLAQDIVRWMDKQSYVRLDLGVGEGRPGARLANAGREVLDGYIGLPSTATFLRGAAYGLRRAVEALPLGGVSALPARAMRRHDLMRGLR